MEKAEKSKLGEYLRGLALIADYGEQRGEKLSFFSEEEKTQLIEKYSLAEAHLEMVHRLLGDQIKFDGATVADLGALTDICYGALEKLYDLEKMIKEIKPLQVQP
ncbi:hypothetical protein BAC1_01598 [uncultured bacterium]|nr:hypothetical protein BAC1_01598 [uncultured bacterium]